VHDGDTRPLSFDLAYLVIGLRRARPDMVLHFGGDCGFEVPAMYDVCEWFRVWYTYGLSSNSFLQRETEGLLAEAVPANEPDPRRKPEP
jgi:hypothetical protein